MHLDALPLDDGVEHAVDENFSTVMNDVTALYQSLQDSQQRTDFVDALCELVQSFMPVDLNKLHFPKDVATKGRSKKLKGSRIPSRFEVAEKQDKAKERAKPKEEIKGEEMDIPSHKDDHVVVEQQGKKRSSQFADAEELWPKHRSYRRQRMDIPE